MCDHSTNQSLDSARKCCAEMVQILSAASIKLAFGRGSPQQKMKNDGERFLKMENQFFFNE